MYRQTKKTDTAVAQTEVAIAMAKRGLDLYIHISVLIKC